MDVEKPPKKSRDGFDEKSLKKDLITFLSRVRLDTSFATFGLLSNVPLPGLTIDRLGQIGIPLSERDAKAVIEECHRAPFGRGLSLIFVSPLNSPENAEKITFANPKWMDFVCEITKRAGKELGVIGGTSFVKATFYKLLIYEEGAMFKPHQDSEKEEGMFGTLVICLPTLHEGGTLVGKHRGQTLTFETDKHSAFDYTFLAWYSDINHEIKPVTSGNRVVLVYNLVRDNSYFGAQGANRLYEEKQNLRDTLDRWNQAEINGQNETPHMLVYSLDHQYTEASLKLSSMKAEDYVKAKCLQELCLELDMCFILGNVERRIDGECDEYSDREGFHSIQDEDPRDITRLHYMTDYNGSAVMRGHLSSYLFEIKLDLEDFVSNPYGDDRSLDHEDFSGDTGNEGTNATHTYRDTVVVIFAKPSHNEYFQGLVKRGTIKWSDKKATDKES